MLIHEWQYVFQCDACGKSDSMANELRERTVKLFRQQGWKVDGHKVFCQECKERRRKERLEGQNG